MGSCVSSRARERNRNENTDIRRITEYNLPDFLESFKKKLPKIIRLTDDMYLKRKNKCKSLFPVNFPDKRECLICWKKMCNCKKCQNVVLKTCCDQYYHIKCLDNWMKCKSLCPICKGFIIILKHIDYDKKTKKRKVVGYETYTYQLYDLDGTELPIQRLWEPVIDIEGLFPDEYEDFNEYNSEISDGHFLDESSNEYFDEESLEEIQEESLEEIQEELLEEIQEESSEEIQEESSEEIQEENVQEEDVQEEDVQEEDVQEIIENSVVRPVIQEVERFVGESADRESIVITEIKFTSSAIQVI